MGLLFLLVSLSGFRISNNCIYQKVEFVSSTSRIKPGTEIDDLGDGFYSAKVEKQIDGLVNDQGTNWKVKGDKSTFFPDSWSTDKIQAEIANAFQNKTLVGTNKYQGFSTTNHKVVMYMEEGTQVIKSAYVEFN